MNSWAFYGREQRRAVAASSGAGSGAITQGTETNFVQGKLGGGGFAYRLQIAPDGSLAVSANTPNVYLKNPGTSSKWFNSSVSPNMDGIGIGPGNFGTPLYHGWAPDSQRIFSIFTRLDNPLGPDRGAYHMQQQHCAVYGSDNKGATWYMTGLTNIAGFSPVAPGGAGPLITFDPLNRDICYIMDPIGIVRRTYDGGVTWSIVNTLMSMLPTATVSGDYNAGYGGATITVNSNPIISAGGPNSWCAYDVTNPLALGTDPNFSVGFGGTSTTMNVGPLATRDGSTGSGASIRNGDVLRFGLAGAITIDPTGGSIANPGGSGVASKIIYFSWQLGGTGIWRTTDGNPENATLITGSPVSVGRLLLSNDGGLAGSGNNTLYFTSGDTADPFWRYVPLSAPGSSGLTPNTFLNMNPVHGGDGWATVVPDPKTQGRVLVISGRGHTQLSTTYGSTSSFSGPSEGSFPTMVAGNGGDNAPWMTLNDPIQIGDAVFDPVLSNTLWMCDGNGIWWKNPSTSSTTWTTAMDDLQSLIITNIVKTPSPNGKIYITCQDHVYIYANVNQNVTCDYGPFGIPTNGYGITYSPADPNKVFIQSYGSGFLKYASDGVTFNDIAKIIGTPFPGIRGGAASVYCINSVAKTAAVSAGGSGYAVNDTIVLAGGSAVNPTILRVASLSGSAVATVTIQDPGSYSTSTPSNPAAQSSTSGSGTGATFTMTWAFGTGYTPTSGTATYNNVALTGGNGSGATANITVTNGSISAVTFVNNGDLFYDFEILTTAAANIGGTGSGFSFFENLAGPFLTSNGSSTVTGTFVGHGLTSANKWTRFMFTGGSTLTAAEVAMSTSFVNPPIGSLIRGSGYAVNDTITIAGGVFTTAAVLKVTSVSSGAITGISIQTAGAYTNSNTPANPVSQSSTSGSGTGAEFNLTWKFNNVSVDDQLFQMTVVDANHISFTASTTANATGWGGGLGVYLGINGCVTGPGNYLGIGLSNLACVNPSVGVTNIAVSTFPYFQYGTFDGTNWKFDYSLLNGTTKLIGNTGGPYGIRTYVTATDDGSFYYFDGDQGNNATAKLYKSTDGGATMTVVSTPGMFVFGPGATIFSVPGHPTHLFICPGASGESVSDVNNSGLYVSTDSGATWNPFSNTTFAITGFAGLSATGGAYPSIYFMGRTSVDAAINPAAGYIYRADDLDPVARTATWKRLDNMKKVNADGWLGGIHPDPEVAGKFYIGTNDTGYLIGSLS